MKRFVLALLVVVVAGAGWLVMRNQPAEEAATPTTVESTNTTVDTTDETPLAEVGESPAVTAPLVAGDSTEKPPAVSLPALFDTPLDGKNFTVGHVLARNSAYTRYHISYRSDGLRVTGIMNVPTGKGPFPVLLLNHGYIHPSVYTNGRGLKREQDYLARQKYVVIHSDYRCHAGSDCPKVTTLEHRLGYVRDVMNALDALKRLKPSYADTTRVGMLGHSMGGGIAQTVMVMKPDLVQAIVLFAPVSTNAADSFARYTQQRPAEAAAIIKKFGSPQSNPAFWKTFSPRTYLDRTKVPILLHHGTTDADVPLAWSESTVRQLQAMKKSITFHTYRGQPHEFTSSWGLVMQRTTSFFNRHVAK